MPQLVEQTPLLVDEGAQLGELEEYALELVRDALDREGELRAPIVGSGRELQRLTARIRCADQWTISTSQCARRWTFSLTLSPRSLEINPGSLVPTTIMSACRSSAAAMITSAGSPMPTSYSASIPSSSSTAFA